MKLPVLFLLFVLLLITLAQAQETATATEEKSTTLAGQATLQEEDLDLDEPLPKRGNAATATDAEETTSTAATTNMTDQALIATENENRTSQEKDENSTETSQPVHQSGPFVDLLGHQLYSLQMIDEAQAQLTPHYTNEALRGKKVVGLYFSADWCGPCRQFTPELVQFYNKMNSRRGHKDDFEIVWVSRCRDMQSYGQYFTHMNWLAMPPEEAMGERGQMLSSKYKVKSIPTLVLLDDLGNVITTDARSKIPQDKAGIGFPWRNPLVTLYTTVFPRSLRMMVKGQVDTFKGKLVQRIKGLVGMKTT